MSLLRGPGEVDDGQFVILGAASAFEGTVNFRFIDSNDEVLYENYTTSTLGMGWEQSACP